MKEIFWFEKIIVHEIRIHISAKKINNLITFAQKLARLNIFVKINVLDGKFIYFYER